MSGRPEGGSMRLHRAALALVLVTLPACSQYTSRSSTSSTSMGVSATSTGGASQPSESHASAHGSARPDEPKGLWFEGEKHLTDVVQLTFGGQNAEAYWSPSNDGLIYQWTPVDAKCDQIYTMKADGSEKHLVSTGKGRTTCS